MVQPHFSLAGPIDGIIREGNMPTDSHMPSIQYIARNDFGVAVLNSNSISGITVAWQDDPHVTSAPIGGYTAVYPKDGNVGGGMGMMGTTQGEASAQGTANKGSLVAYYLNGGTNFFASWAFNIYAAIFGADNTDAAADIADAAARHC